MEWKYAQNEKPLCYVTNCWDGKRSDEVVCEDNKHRKFVARVYEIVDNYGNTSMYWIDNYGYVIDGEIIRWCSIPAVSNSNCVHVFDKPVTWEGCLEYYVCSKCGKKKTDC